jgi:glycosyltransferase involved in cell wall biosynthesis
MLSSSWGRRLPAAGKRLVKGACHGADMVRLGQCVDGFGAQVLHLQWSPLPILDRWAIRMLRRRVPVIFTLHDSNPYQGSASWLMRQGYAGLLGAVDAIVVHTPQAQRRVAAIGVDPAATYLVPHGLLGSAAAPAPQARRGPRERLVLLQFGKIKPYKGIDLLLEALALLPRGIRERLDVRIIGKPYMDTGALERFVATHGLAGCVTLRFEFVSESEAEQQFAEADAVLLPYREIDASGAAMTAIAHQLPVLATSIEGFRDLFAGGGRLVPAGDPTAVAQVLAEWAVEPDQLNALAEAMRRVRVGIPSWRKIAQMHLAIYEEAYSRWIDEG